MVLRIGSRVFELLNYDKASARVADLVARPGFFMGVVAFVLIWAIVGPLVGFAERWELFMNTATTIMTTLLVALLHNEQFRNEQAMNAKLDRQTVAFISMLVRQGEIADGELIRELRNSIAAEKP